MKKYMPYGVDLEFQYSTYKNIGKSYQIEFKARKKFFYKIVNYIRKFFNKDEKKYKNFDTFSQWKNNICEEFEKIGAKNKEDFIRYIMGVRRNKEIMCDMIGAVVTPIYVVVLTMGATLFTNFDTLGEDIKSNLYLIKTYIMYGSINMGIILVVVLMFLMAIFRDNKSKQFFCDDLIKILKNEMPTTN